MSREGENISLPEPHEQRHEQLRSGFSQELDQLKLQVEMMALKVDEQIRRAIRVLEEGDQKLADRVIDGDDEIDDMLVSLTERCYDLLARQSPVASDLRLVVSVLRILSDLERQGDLSLRIVNLCPDQPLLASNPETFDILKGMASEALELYRLSIKAWASLDLTLAQSLDERDEAMDAYNERLMSALMELDGPGAVPVAIKTLLAGRALERIADHAVMVGDRLKYMVTGDIQSLGREIGPHRD